MADRDAKVVIKQKDGSDKITIYPHTKADIVELIGIPGSGGTHTAYTVNGTTVTTTEDAFASILGSDGYVAKRVNWCPPSSINMIAGQGNNFTQDLHKGDVIVPGTEIPAYITSGCQGITLGPKLIDSTSHKIAMSLLPDVILGQLMYGGTITTINDGDEIKRATITNNLRTKLGLSSSVTTIDVINDSTDNTSATPKQYGYTTLEGVYFICQDSGYFGPDPQDPDVHAIDDIRIGDWLISTGSSWQKVDNTDVPVTLSGNTLTVDGTSINIMTTDTQQTITGQKSFTGNVYMNSIHGGLSYGTQSESDAYKLHRRFNLNLGNSSFDTTTLDFRFQEVRSDPNDATAYEKVVVIEDEDNDICVLDTGLYYGTHYPENEVATKGDIHGFLPLTAGSSYPLTGDLYIGQANPSSATHPFHSQALKFYIDQNSNHTCSIYAGEQNYGTSVNPDYRTELRFSCWDDIYRFASDDFDAVLHLSNLVDEDRHYQFPNRDGTFALGATSGIRWDKVSGTWTPTTLVGYADSTGVIELADSGIGVNRDDTEAGEYLTATYSVLTVNSKGIAIDGGQLLALCSAESGTIYNSVVDGGFYFLEDASA